MYTSQSNIDKAKAIQQRIMEAANMALEQGYAGLPLSGLALEVSNELDEGRSGNAKNFIRQGYEHRKELADRKLL